MFWDHEHVPRLSKALITLVLGFIVLALSWKINNNGMFWSVFAGAVLTILLGLGEVYLLVADSLRRDIDVQVDMVRALANAPSEVRDAIGLLWPRYNFKFTGAPVVEWENTVPVDVFYKFMQDSNEQYISPERNWPEVEPRRQWHLIRSRLIELDLVLPDSAAGPKSDLWRVNGYKHAWDRWMRYRVQVVDYLKELE